VINTKRKLQTRKTHQAKKWRKCSFSSCKVETQFETSLLNVNSAFYPKTNNENIKPSSNISVLLSKMSKFFVSLAFVILLNGSALNTLVNAQDGGSFGRQLRGKDGRSTSSTSMLKKQNLRFLAMAMNGDKAMNGGKFNATHFTTAATHGKAHSKTLLTTILPQGKIGDDTTIIPSARSKNKVGDFEIYKSSANDGNSWKSPSMDTSIDEQKNSLKKPDKNMEESSPNQGQGEVDEDESSPEESNTFTSQDTSDEHIKPNKPNSAHDHKPSFGGNSRSKPSVGNGKGHSKPMVMGMMMLAKKSYAGNSMVRFPFH